MGCFWCPHEPSWHHHLYFLGLYKGYVQTISISLSSLSCLLCIFHNFLYGIISGSCFAMTPSTLLKALFWNQQNLLSIVLLLYHGSYPYINTNLTRLVFEISFYLISKYYSACPLFDLPFFVSTKFQLKRTCTGYHCSSIFKIFNLITVNLSLFNVISSLYADAVLNTSVYRWSSLSPITVDIGCIPLDKSCILLVKTAIFHLNWLWHYKMSKQQRWNNVPQ